MNAEHMFVYHVRDADTGAKLVGGTLHAKDFNDAAEQACRSYQAVEDCFYWIDKDGCRVFLSLSVCPKLTKRGQAQQAALRKAKARAEREKLARRAAEDAQERLDDLVSQVGIEKATAALKQLAERAE